jgi:hypothetical protein
MLPSEQPDLNVTMYNGIIDVAHLDDEDDWIAIMYDQQQDAQDELDLTHIDPLGDDDQMAIHDGIGTHPLGHSDDYVDLEYIERIKTATPAELKEIQSEFFRQEDIYTGRVYPPKNKWMNSSQTRAAWWLINARKEALTKQALENVSKQTAQVIEILFELDHLPQMRALIGCYSRGKSFDYFGERLKWKRPSQADVWACWAVYREREAVLA